MKEKGEQKESGRERKEQKSKLKKRNGKRGEKKNLISFLQ